MNIGKIYIKKIQKYLPLFLLIIIALLILSKILQNEVKEGLNNEKENKLIPSWVYTLLIIIFSIGSFSLIFYLAYKGDNKQIDPDIAYR